MSTDRIEKSAVLHASLDRVWRAISDAREFGTWFGMRVDGPFVAGTTVSCQMTGTAVDEDIAAAQREHEVHSFPLHIVTVDPPRRFAFRWNPVAGAEFADLTTLVEFTLTETDGEVLLEIVESGFDAVPAEHRGAAFADNSQGWAEQLKLIGRYVTAAQWA
ncbi:SRPBCC family protein [[Mycobacterium] burgundiense]|uniref:SRPBCC family protein n=1 Tax=[Mycobacterium] burgundiense TaxID=3064286 RepID=A0ABM9LY97_9MYCO|nr:SRPBCC family protein [Mycolicibacterium sp. MU0053]CAJ1506773.1 SRPBCC family protein [Mycolicibacterium sp. MU0053]